MQISEKNKELIELAIQNNELYIGNEHLFEKFYREILVRTYLVLNSKKDEEKYSYLNEIANKVMGDVIGREKTSIEYRKMLQSASSNGIVSLKTIAETETRKFNNVIDFREINRRNISSVDDPIEYANQDRNSKPTIQKILEILYTIHQKSPLQYYFQIFYMRYYTQMKQEEIAKSLNISQSELSLRFAKMLEEMKDLGLEF